MGDSGSELKIIRVLGQDSLGGISRFFGVGVSEYVNEKASNFLNALESISHLHIEVGQFPAHIRLVWVSLEQLLQDLRRFFRVSGREESVGKFARAQAEFVGTT